MMKWLVRIAIVVIWTICIYGFLGGSFVYRENLPDGRYNLYILTMYKTLPPPPKGPSYCNFLDAGAYALALPCDLKPPFVGWLQGGKY
jgi:hypothetical protein